MYITYMLYMIVATCVFARPMPQNTAKGAAKYPGGYPWDMVQHPVLCDPSVQQSSGYISVSSRTKHLFYWFFESRTPSHSNTPVILWLNGGPGCSSMTGLLTGIGPCRVTSDGHSTTWNPFGWNKDAHLLFLDQPANSGYSYGANVTSTWDAASDVAEFLQTFYQKFPQYRGPLHVMGESYAAHYVPANRRPAASGQQHIHAVDEHCGRQWAV
ncbi:hypothetical protein DL89DRAFT_27863 [Linderina pennispora]|uniref:carboxypeptidase C n=1 Tax=Linderina pennispora TaxID=61395 RepID=A0A1Y1W3S0_9FUNG|nr:uncharacterized protein DL89DRAFT_27863 [Linderina pennispora]ORX68190.1 hypothetical protein DL89DRAFT_27863 [Linderina pennispora]